MKKLIIAEKPSLAMEIVKAIGKMTRNDGYFENESYIVSFAFGHLMVLQDIDDYYKRGKTKWTIEELPFVPQAFLFKLRDDSGVIKQYNVLKNLIKREDVTHIVNCGDADREGEVIINNIIYKALHELKLQKEVERLWLKSINQEEIQNSLNRLKPIVETKNLYSEGLARTYLDWLYGINLTRYVSIKAGDLLPVGRVLTPIVKKVYDRKKEIENFVPENYVELEVLIKKDDQELKATVKNSKFKAPIDRDKIKELVKNLNLADSIVTDKQIKSVEKKPKKLFSLTTLQNHMVKNHKMTLEDTLKHVQSLYEKGYVTYPRTNTEYLHTSEIEDVKKLVQIYSDSYDIVFKNTKALFDDSKVESHSALLPTVKRTDGRNFNEFERQVYSVIFSRFLANFCKEKTIVEETKIQIKALDYMTEIKGNSIKQLGFYKYEKPDSKEKLLPYFELNEIVDAEYIDADKETSPPKLLTLVEMN
ncbi:MAG: DNA topoisomerase, partial [Proteocatella sp.]